MAVRLSWRSWQSHISSSLGAAVSIRYELVLFLLRLSLGGMKKFG
ncbi:hypothetical protein ACB092_01G041500 [Castanea dentata]